MGGGINRPMFHCGARRVVAEVVITLTFPRFHPDTGVCEIGGRSRSHAGFLARAWFLSFYDLFSRICCRQGEVKERGESRVSLLCVL